ncbi:SET domain-containing protein [Obba rivulosa]|uniref:SET domain-containing protein n=1 Tax=Obba rivulosa TaxID=1052685 RepID=A0A8E2DHC8_9APHY|nr:SET domain-containing protein [Obba rivulosa]
MVHESICFQCNALQADDGPRLNACAICKRATYCNKDCQRKHWKVHKVVCCPPGSTDKTTHASSMRALQDSFQTLQLIEKDPAAPLPAHPPAINPDEYRFAGLPATFFDASMNDPDGVTECILYGGMKEAILAQPGFPTPVPRRAGRAHRIAPAGPAGLGMFATRALRAHELIFAERPLLVMPVAFCGFGAAAVDRTSAMAQCEEIVGCAVKRMTEENRLAFRALANSHLHDGSPELYGIVRTNGFEAGDKLQEAVPQLPEGVMGTFTVIGRELARANHSCSPNAYVEFDPLSLSLRISARREIAAGEEITTTYAHLLEPYSGRRRTLVPYGFNCVCNACQDRAGSDARRRKIKASGHLYKDSTLDKWLKEPLRDDDRYEAQLLNLLKLIEDEKLEILTHHVQVQATLASVYAALGDRQNALKYAKEVAASELPIRGVLQPAAEKELLNKAARLLVEPYWNRKVKFS